VGAVQDGSVALLAAAPLPHVLLSFALLFANTFISTMTLSAAAQWCTAAESAIVSTSTGMGFGFLVQTAFFGAPPNPLALAGAALMLGGVVLMTTLQSAPAPASTEVELEPGISPLLAVNRVCPADAKPADPGLMPGASDVSMCDYDFRNLDEDLADIPDGDLPESPTNSMRISVAV